MKTRRSKKGFTLMELVIVLTIMGILLAIIVPSWGYFIRRARERSANAKAKVVFNAAQTEITRINMKERPTFNVATDPTADSMKQEAAKKALFVGDTTNGEFYYYWDGAAKTGYKVDDKHFPQTPQKNAFASAEDNDAFARAINNIVGDKAYFYKIYVKDYNVKSVVYSEYENGRYKGTYPLSIGTNQLTDAIEDDIREQSVISINMKDID